MFGKKKEALPDFRLYALMTETVIDGTVPGSIDLYFDMADPYELTNARLRMARPGGTPDRTVASFRLMGSQVVVFVPEVDYTLMAMYSQWKMYTKVLGTGVLHAGPYLLEGRLMSVMEQLEQAMPMFDVRITPAVQGVSWGKIEAPFALLNTHWLLGWEPAG